MVALELLPGRERAGINHAVEEQDSVEVVDLVLERPPVSYTHLVAAEHRAQHDRRRGCLLYTSRCV